MEKSGDFTLNVAFLRQSKIVCMFPYFKSVLAWESLCKYGLSTSDNKKGRRRIFPKHRPILLSGHSVLVLSLSL